MSRIGKLPVQIPEKVSVEQTERLIVAKGPKGELSYQHRPEVKVTVSDGSVAVETDRTDRLSHSLHGLTRTLIANLVKGVSDGFTRDLEVNGVGYRTAVQGAELTLHLGYSHPIVYTAPEGITISVTKNVIRVEGADKQLVGQVASDIRAFRPPEPYKGKGIRYTDEHVRRKAGKTGKAGA
jgi:large subunit ribosomal protein L6